MKKQILLLAILVTAILSSCTKSSTFSGPSGFDGFTTDTTIDVVFRVPAQSYPNGYNQTALISGDSITSINCSTLRTEGAFDYITQRIRITPDVFVIQFSFENCSGNKYYLNVMEESDLYQRFLSYN